jgi:hypothetical protein
VGWDAKLKNVKNTKPLFTLEQRMHLTGVIIHAHLMVHGGVLHQLAKKIAEISVHRNVKKIYTHINDKGSICFGRATFISYIRLFGVVK